LVYILVALKPEAQAFVDKYRLKKSKLELYTLFSNENMMLIISGLGVESARNATQTLINHFDITDEDTYINIGICGADESYKLGELIEIGSIVYDSITYTFDETKAELTCLDEECSEDLHKIVDMESYGFYDAVTHNPAIKNFSILKVVSDHFQPQTVTKEKTKELIFNAIKDKF